MAIKRCPYCRAIIDEKDQYCNNCGTQLLFPEDESVEEEIKGEKILDEPEEEKNYDIPEPGDETHDFNPAGGEKDHEDSEEEVIVVDEKDERLETKAEAEPEIAVKEVPLASADEIKEESLVEASAPETAGRTTDETEEPAAPSEQQVQTSEFQPPEKEESGGRPTFARPATFDTKELDKIGRTAELGKEQIEEFLERLKTKEDKNKSLKADSQEAKDSLPPWAKDMKPQVAEDAEEPEGQALEEEETEERPSPPVADSGIGLPEKVTQASLPFEKLIRREEPAVFEETPASVGAEKPAQESVQEEHEEEVLPPFKLSIFMKAKAFDLLFVAVFWLVSLWMGARSMGVTLFRMFGTAPGALFAFYGILLFFYFFLFYFFLAETLGDRLFRETEEI